MSRQPVLSDLDPFGLTKREQEVLAVLLKGKTSLAIADELFVSELTIKNLITGICVKMGANNRMELFHRFLAREKGVKNLRKRI